MSWIADTLSLDLGRAPFWQEPRFCPAARRAHLAAPVGRRALAAARAHFLRVSNRVSVFPSWGRCARAGRSLAKPSPRSAAILRPAAPGSRCPPAGAVTTRQAAASCRAKLRGGAARERQHAPRGLGKPAAP